MAISSHNPEQAPFSDNVRQRLITENFALADFLAKRKTRASHVSEDTRQNAYVGLVEAANKYNPNSGVEFGAYAQLRINGAITDGMRRESPLTRYGQGLAKQVIETWNNLAQQNQTEPSPQQVANELNRSQTDIEALNFTVIPLETTEGKEHEEDLDRSRQLQDISTDEEFGKVESNIDRTQQKLLLQTALGQLKPRARRVVEAYVIGGLTYKEIAGELGVTESRVGQIYWGSIRSLRAKITRDI